MFTYRSISQLLVVSLNLFYFPIVLFFYIYKHIQFNTITCKQKGKRVEPHVLKLIYGSPEQVVAAGVVAAVMTMIVITMR